MAQYVQPTAAQEAAYVKWAKARPKSVRALALRFRPWELYRLTTTNQRVILYSISEDGTVTVLVPAKYNPLGIVDFTVFGIDPETLEPCAVPQNDEELWDDRPTGTSESVPLPHTQNKS